MSLNSKNSATGFTDNGVENCDENSSTGSLLNKSKTNLVIRTTEDSDVNLNALFDCALNPSDSKRPLQVPFRMRKLPNSFFNPPAVNAKPSTSTPSSTSASTTTASHHSRANSADSAYDAGSQQNVNKPVDAILPSVLQSNVAAANSNSNLTQTAAVAPAAVVAVGAAAATSGGSTGGGSGGAGVVLPKRLEISHSRAHSSPASLQQTYGLQASDTQSIGDINVTGLKIGSGGGSGGGGGSSGVFATSRTVNFEQANQIAGLQIDSVGQQNIAQNINSPIQCFHMKQRSYDVVSNIQLLNELGALPPGWEQAKTQDGMIYYLNHLTKTTQWEDPRIQYKQQQQQMFQQSLQQAVNLKESNKDGLATNEVLGPLPEGWEQAFTESGDVYFINHVDRTTSWNDPRIPFSKKFLKEPKSDMMNWNLRQINKDQDIFKQRREQNTLNRSNEPLQIDPFLSGDNHARQESSDSGLSLSSNTFSVNTELMSQIDDSMDCISDNDNITALSVLDCPDNLVSSLHLESNICNEMFNDVDNILNS